jgi:hypothetical protein
VVWARLLWRISKLNLHLSAAHPDRTGGLGFLGATPYAFVPLLVAQGSLLSGLIAAVFCLPDKTCSLSRPKPVD